MSRTLAAPVLVIAALAATGAAAPHRAPGEPAQAATAAPSRLQSHATPSPAPGAAPARRAPTTPPATWQAVERSGDTGHPIPGKPPRPAQPTLPPLPPLPPPPPPQTTNPVTPPPPVQPPTQAPAVEYFGITAGPGGTYAILRINGQVHVARPGQTVAGVRILSAAPEHVRIRVGGAERNLNRLTPGGRTGP